MTLLTAKETNCENVTGAKLGLLKALRSGLAHPGWTVCGQWLIPALANLM